MIRARILLETPSVTLAVFDHPPGDVHHDPELEVAERHAISFVESGSFDVHVRGEKWRFSPGTIFVTERELECLQIIAKSLSNNEAARVLGLSKATIRTHLEHIYQKLDVTNRVEAVTEGIRQGIIDL